MRKSTRKTQNASFQNGRRVRYVLLLFLLNSFFCRFSLSFVSFSRYPVGLLLKLTVFGLSLSLSLVTRYNSVFKQEIMAHRRVCHDRRGLEERATSRTREEKTGGDEEGNSRERKLAELQQDAVDAGHSKKSERLDWMYKGSLAEGTRLEDTKFTRAEGRGRTGRVETRTRTTRGLAAGTTGTEGGISRAEYGRPETKSRAVE